DQFGAAVEDLGAVALQPSAVQALQPCDFAVLGLDQRPPVEAALADAPAEPCRILEMLGKLRSIDEQLLRHASADHAGPAEPVFLGNPHLLAQRCRDAPRPHPAGTAAD